jgi:GNAT superfamily N-acetyltransferase
VVRTDVRRLVEGHAMYVRGYRGCEAELAIVVEDGWRSRGIGRQLLDVLAAKAASRGVHLFTGSVLGENRRALGALVTMFPGMCYEVRDGAYQVRAPLRELRGLPGL